MASTSLRASATRKASWALIRWYCRAVRCRIDAVLWAGTARVAKRQGRGWVGWLRSVLGGRCMMAKDETKDGRARQAGRAVATSGTDIPCSKPCGITRFHLNFAQTGLRKKNTS